MGFMRPMHLSFLIFVCCIVSLLAVSKAESIYEKDANVNVISSHEQFVAEVETSDSIWLLHVYSSVNPKQAAVVSAIAKLMKGIFSVAAVDMESYRDAETLKQKYSISSSSTLLILADDKQTKAHTTLSTGDLNLQKLTDSLVQAAGQTISERSRALNGASTTDSSNGGGHGSSILVTSTDATFANDVLNNPLVVMVAFTAPWCGHCKRLEPEWNQAAQILAKQAYARNAIRLVWVDATENPKVTSKFQVKGYPTIKIFPGTNSSSAVSHNKRATDAKDYTGERNAAGMVQALLEEVDRTGIPLEIAELTSAKVLQEHCAGSNHICILAGLPHIVESGADGRRKIWKRLAKSPRPVVALSMDRKAYAVMRGAFTEKGMASFLHSLTTGRQMTVHMQSLPTIEAVEPWDGQDTVPGEEEFSLEDIMGEDL
ncbi:hypothetical protein MPSEU_000600400 [Mayamaea pseudoterrestris]|nr:hypothetical protein MPSEU_000600400 [Mayamaea pseudoterrestris]